MFEGTRIQVDKLENGYGAKVPSFTNGGEPTEKKFVFGNFEQLVIFLRKQFDAQEPRDTCSIADPVAVLHDHVRQLSSRVNNLEGYEQERQNRNAARVARASEVRKAKAKRKRK